jgi:cell wall-associated NlpC family hydrolase
MRRLRRTLIDTATRVLTTRRRSYRHILPGDAGLLRATLKKGDVLLVDGDQRVSQVIKYLTQSSWSHAALYVGDELWRRHPERRPALEAAFGPDARHLLVEALMEEGVVAAPVAKYGDHNVRVCRPRGLRAEHCQQVLDEALAQLGARYGVRCALSLARYFFPVSLIPARWRRLALARGGDLTTQIVCSTLIARAFQQVGFPILPAVTPQVPGPDEPGWRRWLPRQPYPHLFHREATALVTPRDFDLSPYFDVVKLTGVTARNFDYRRIRWA